MDPSNFERKKRYLLSLYPDIEEGDKSEEERNDASDDSSVTSFEKEAGESSFSNYSSSSTEEGSIGSLSTHSDHGGQGPLPSPSSSSEKPRRPFWVPNRYHNQSHPSNDKTSAKKSEFVCSPDDQTPAGISPDPECDEENEKRQALSFYMILVASLILVGMGSAIIVLGLTLSKKSGGNHHNSEEDDSQVRVYRPVPTSDNVECDISEIEATCRLEENKERELDLSEIPKCVQDNFNLVYVRAGHDAYYQLHSIEPLQSCSSEGMALKRLSAMEHEKSTTGLLNCQYTAYSWYYEYGEVEWWTDEGVQQTNVCERYNVFCSGDSPGSLVAEAFVTEQGEECMLSTLSL